MPRGLFLTLGFCESLAVVAQAIALYHKNGIEFGPAKAANAGGVAVSGLEMAQNSARLSWSREEVDDKLKSIMKAIFDAAKSVRSLLPLEWWCHVLGGARICGRAQGIHKGSDLQ